MLFTTAQNPDFGWWLTLWPKFAERGSTKVISLTVIVMTSKLIFEKIS